MTTTGLSGSVFNNVKTLLRFQVNLSILKNFKKYFANSGNGKTILAKYNHAVDRDSMEWVMQNSENDTNRCARSKNFVHS